MAILQCHDDLQSLHMQASATSQNVMNMADMASRTAQLWLEFAENEASHPEQALPAPDPYNQAFYSFTRKDPDNEVGLTMSAAQWPLFAVPFQSDQCTWDAVISNVTVACDGTVSDVLVRRKSLPL